MENREKYYGYEEVRVEGITDDWEVNKCEGRRKGKHVGNMERREGKEIKKYMRIKLRNEMTDVYKGRTDNLVSALTALSEEYRCQKPDTQVSSPARLVRPVGRVTERPCRLTAWHVRTNGVPMFVLLRASASLSALRKRA